VNPDLQSATKPSKITAPRLDLPAFGKSMGFESSLAILQILSGLASNLVFWIEHIWDLGKNFIGLKFIQFFLVRKHSALSATHEIWILKLIFGGSFACR